MQDGLQVPRIASLALRSLVANGDAVAVAQTVGLVPHLRLRGMARETHTRTPNKHYGPLIKWCPALCRLSPPRTDLQGTGGSPACTGAGANDNGRGISW